MLLLISLRYSFRGPQTLGRMRTLILDINQLWTLMPTMSMALVQQRGFVDSRGPYKIRRSRAHRIFRMFGECIYLQRVSLICGSFSEPLSIRAQFRILTHYELSKHTTVPIVSSLCHYRLPYLILYQGAPAQNVRWYATSNVCSHPLCVYLSLANDASRDRNNDYGPRASECVQTSVHICCHMCRWQNETHD